MFGSTVKLKILPQDIQGRIWKIPVVGYDLIRNLGRQFSKVLLNANTLWLLTTKDVLVLCRPETKYEDKEIFVRFFTTSDANSEARIEEVLDALDDDGFEEYFAEKYHDDSGIKMTIIFMCRDPRIYWWWKMVARFL